MLNLVGALAAGVPTEKPAGPPRPVAGPATDKRRLAAAIAASAALVAIVVALRYRRRRRG